MIIKDSICHNHNPKAILIHFEEIFRGMQAGFSYFDKKAPTAAIRSLFDKYDANSNGKLEEQEIQFLLEGELGFSQEQSGAYFLLLDKNGDHNISFEEFQDMASQRGTLRNFERQSQVSLPLESTQLLQEF